MIEYIRGKDGRRVDVRDLHGEFRGALHGFRVTQGACSDGRNIYMVFERKETLNCTHRCKIVKLDAKTLEVEKISGELRIGHGNDMTYRGGILYITHSKGDLTIHRVSAKTLEQDSGLPVMIPKELRRKRIYGFNGIACFGTGFILRVMGGSGMLITDRRFRGIRYFRTKKFFRTSQGMDQKDGLTYRAYSKLQSETCNYLAVFDDRGKLVRREKLNIRGEMESVMFVGDTLYGTVYRKKILDDGIMRFMAFVFSVKY